MLLWVHLTAEVGGLATLAAVWVASLCGRRGAWLREVTWRLQQLWAGLLLGAVRVLFRLRLEVAGDDAVASGPVIVLMRHASIAPGDDREDDDEADAYGRDHAITALCELGLSDR